MQKGMISAVSGRRARVIKPDGTVTGWLYIPGNADAPDPGDPVFFETEGKDGLILGVITEQAGGGGLPAGGAANAVLSKKDATDGNVEWRTIGELFLLLHPVGDIVINTTGVNPGTTYGGTWVAWGSGRVPVGVDSGQSEFDAVEKTGGEKEHQLIESEMPAHTHVQDAHTHVQDAHTHVQNSHNHTQDSHNHSQNSHNHSQNSHGHGDNFSIASGGSHYHEIWWGTDRPISLSSGDTGSYGWYSSSGYRTGYSSGSVYAGAMNAKAAGSHGHTLNGGVYSATASNNSTTATNNSTTATNNAATAVNQNATAVNQNATTVNQNAGGDGAHNNMPPFITCYMFKRTV